MRHEPQMLLIPPIQLFKDGRTQQQRKRGRRSIELEPGPRVVRRLTGVDVLDDSGSPRWPKGYPGRFDRRSPNVSTVGHLRRRRRTQFEGFCRASLTSFDAERFQLHESSPQSCPPHPAPRPFTLRTRLSRARQRQSVQSYFTVTFREMVSLCCEGNLPFHAVSLSFEIPPEASMISSRNLLVRIAEEPRAEPERKPRSQRLKRFARAGPLTASRARPVHLVAGPIRFWSFHLSGSLREVSRMSSMR